MANRMICYGYGIINGELSVIENEAEIVRRIFKEYADGKLLNEIAEELSSENVEFFMGNCSWNKNRIARIIENEKYIGADGYPQIVDDDDFFCAKRLKDSKGAKKKRFDETTEYLRNNTVVCAECGRHLNRISKWRKREKWICRNGCKYDAYISDDVINYGINKIVERICANPDIVKTDKERKSNSVEAKKYANEINRLLGSKNPSFGAGKKLIFHLAELKFESGNERTPDVYTDMLIEDCKRVFMQGKADKAFIEKFCDEIRVYKTGDITIRLINGTELTTSKGDEYATGSEDNNEDRSESVIVEQK
ncbi:MAG: recombinase family protein [Clostridia bacterium]|nr:recombinase family protein [Clostridia bacterium]